MTVRQTPEQIGGSGGGGGGGGGALLLYDGLDIFNTDPDIQYFAGDQNVLKIFETDASIFMPAGASFSGITLLAVTNSLDAPAVITLRRNGSPTAVTATLGAGATGPIQVTGVGPEVFAAGDVLTVEIDITGKTAGNIDSLRIGIG